MTVVSNTSPIINLAAIEKLELLKEFYGEISIPREVYREITVKGAGQPGDQEVRSSGWIKVIDIKDETLLTSLKTEMHPAEAEAIVLAIESDADLLLLDERLARKKAAKFGIRYMGVLGVLVQAKRKQLIPTIKPLLDELITKAGFWVDQELYHDVLQSAAE